MSVGIPLMILMFLPIASHHTMAYFMFVVSTPAFIYVSHPIFRAGWRALKNRNLNMDVMYSMGIGVSFLASILGTFQIILTREFLFYDSAVMLAAFLTMGRYLEARAKGKTGEAIKKLVGLQPKTATDYPGWHRNRNSRGGCADRRDRARQARRKGPGRRRGCCGRELRR